MIEWNEDGTARYRFVREITSNSIEQMLESTSRRQRMNWYVVRQSSDGNLFAYGDFDPWQPESACRFEDTIVFRSIEGESKHDSFEENDEAWDSFHHQLKNGDEANIITYVDADGIWKALYHTVYSGTPHESVLGVCKQCMRATVDIHEMKGKKAEVLPEGVFRPRLSVTIEIEHFGLYHSISVLISHFVHNVDPGLDVNCKYMNEIIRNKFRIVCCYMQFTMPHGQQLELHFRFTKECRRHVLITFVGSLGGYLQKQLVVMGWLLCSW